MTEQYDEDLTNLTDPTPSDLSEESSLEAAIDDEDEDEDPDVEPGAEGPEGTGVEGADDILEEERDRDAEDDSFYDSDYPSGLGEDDSAAAEQGNRDGDEMVSEGDDAEEVSELDGDTEDVDALGGVDEDIAADGVDLDGTDGGEDPLSGEALG
ncbi:hypothetical protein [Brachybacterium sp. ACRRE]|uniref:hypothetical protein n=1 Tax=Brachybacterium sp. ACRRE TaxID=2918184 RepID=UPI001EF3B6B6|nr:hypothetical protein [Brachybacterium sp. ACRRE]MCG7310675.1 hypothetical protein [Brachybacterium sp. ACRRE]